jgi:hypothetical protein
MSEITRVGRWFYQLVSEVPVSLTWHVARASAGQAIEVAFADEGDADEAGPGSAWRRRVDRSLPEGAAGRVTYRRRVDPQAFRAYDVVTGWWGPERATEGAAWGDCRRHNRGCAEQGGYGSAIVVVEDPEAPGRVVDLDGDEVWPPSGRSDGTARWPRGGAR